MYLNKDITLLQEVKDDSDLSDSKQSRGTYSDAYRLSSPTLKTKKDVTKEIYHKSNDQQAA